MAGSNGPTLVAINWRQRGGGMATFEYKGGAMSSQPMSEEEARLIAEQTFGLDHGPVEIDDGRRWTKKPAGKGLGIKAAFTFGRAGKVGA
jgi:hypothetical protein